MKLKLILLGLICPLVIAVTYVTAKAFSHNFQGAVETRRSDPIEVQSSSCNSDTQYIESSFDVQKDKLDVGHLNLTAVYNLVNASGPRYIVPLTFVGDKQVASPDNLVMHFDCGETKQVTYTIPFDETKPQTINVFPRVLSKAMSPVPKVLLDSNPLRPMTDTEALDYALDHSDVFSINSSHPPTFSAADFAGITYKVVDAKLLDGYIFTTSREAPRHVDYVDNKKTSYPFNVYFSEVTEGDSDIYTVTCLLDDKQVSAFNGHRSWSGRLKQKQAVIIRGSIELQPGWQQLRCVVLNNVYLEGRASLYPHLIRALYVHKTL